MAGRKYGAQYRVYIGVMMRNATKRIYWTESEADLMITKHRSVFWLALSRLNRCQRRDTGSDFPMSEPRLLNIISAGLVDFAVGLDALV